MPFKEATFWYGTLLFGTGLYFWIEGGNRTTAGIILTVLGLVMSVYAVVADYQPKLPKLRLWVVLLLLTWSALAYDIYDRHRPSLMWIWVSGFLGIAILTVGLVAWFQKKHTALTDDKLKELEAKIPQITVNGVLAGLPQQGSQDWEKLYLEENQKRTQFQQDYAIEANRVKALEDKISELGRSSVTLRTRTIEKCDELNRFLSEYGPRPEFPLQPGETDDDHFRRKLTKTLAWKRKMGADFRLRFEESIGILRDEIQVRSSLHEPALDENLKAAASQNCEPKIVEAVRKDLWTLASQLNN
jgi:hypothetical protein